MKHRALRDFEVAVDVSGSTPGEGQKYDTPCIMSFEIENTGAQALTSLILQVKNHPDADWFDYLTDTELTDADKGLYYVAPAASVPHTLAAGATINLGIMLLSGCQFRWKATCASSTPTLAFKGNIQVQ